MLLKPRWSSFERTDLGAPKPVLVLTQLLTRDLGHLTSLDLFPQKQIANRVSPGDHQTAFQIL